LPDCDVDGCGAGGVWRGEADRRDSDDLHHRSRRQPSRPQGRRGAQGRVRAAAAAVSEKDGRGGVGGCRASERRAALAEFRLASGGARPIVCHMLSAGTAAFRQLFDEIGTVDAVGVEERVAKYTTRSIKKNAKVWGLKTAVSMV